MGDTTSQLEGLGAWLQANWLATLVVAVAAFLAFRLARPLVHRLVVRMVRVRAPAGADAALAEAESAKRAGTIEDLLSRVLRGAVVLIVILVLMTLLGLLPVIAGLGLIIAALTVAGQSIILDYLMGALILVEGQYYQGDWIAAAGVEGTVEEVGLRRTVVRDASGTVHSISNGAIRISSNLTRLYASLVVEVPVVQGTDIDRAAAIIDRVGAEMAEDPAWRERLLEPPRFSRVVAITEVGITLRVVGRVRAEDRFAVPGEVNRRILAAFSAEGIELPQRGRVMMMAPAVASAPPAPGAIPPPALVPAAPPADDETRPGDEPD